ncbi:MAG TPA: CvpA family protein [Rhizomicrobium sp.]|jgi:membrane protein required for colicin V production|nr:CvpA family protein [Rhizomicrobium sp.]
MSLAFSLVDLAVVLVVLGSMGYAIYRGFVEETLSIVAWAAAAFAALYLGPWVERMMTSLVSNRWMAMVLGYALAFVVVFIPLQFASYRFSQGVRRSQVGPLDRVLGGTFGIVRGLAILGVAYLIFTAFVPIRQQPRWLTEARTLPLIQSSAEVLLALVPDRGPHERIGSEPPPPAPSDPIGGLIVHHETHAPAAAAPKPLKKHHKKGTGVEDHRGLDRLIEQTGSGGSSNR